MSARATVVALAARAHPRGGAPSGDDETVRRLKAAAAALGKRHPDAISGPSIMSPDGTLVLSLSTPGSILDAMLALAEELRPVPMTFCSAMSDGLGGRAADDDIESAVMASDSVTSLALRGVAETDVRSGRVCVLTPERDDALAALIDLILVTYDGMTERQRQIVALAKQCDTQQEVAKHLDVSRQAVNQSLTAAGWPHLHRAEEAVRGRLLTARPRDTHGRSR